MGKRQRRRKRQQQHNTVQRPVERRHLYPGADRPLLEVHIAPGTPDDVTAMCLAYWEFTEPGTWARNVAAIGSAAQVARTVKGASHASLLTVVCPECTSPATIRSRSDMTATGYWRTGVFPTVETAAARACADCRAAVAAAKAEEAAQAKEMERAGVQQRVGNAGRWLADHRNVPPLEDEAPTVVEALGLLAVIEIMERADTGSFGPRSSLPYTITDSDNGDVEFLKELYGQRWIVPTLPATIADFVFRDDDTVSGVYVDQVPWRLAYWLAEDPVEARRLAAGRMRDTLALHADEVREAVVDFEASMTVEYLDGLLTHKYNEEPIPDHRRVDAYVTARKALEDGFTLGQLVAVAWSAASSSVAWGQRTPGIKPGSVSAASVTNLGKGIGFAKDRAAVEYDLPNWVARPAAWGTALRYLEQHDATTHALATLQSLQQRVNSSSLDVEEVDDVDEASPAGEGEGDRQWWLDMLHTGKRPAAAGPLLTFVVVGTDGALEVRTATAGEMRQTAGAPYGLIDRVPIDGTKSLDAYVPEFASRAEHPPNRAASRMLELLGAGPGLVHGTVVFFQTGTSSHRPRSMDEDHQDLVVIAHRVAQSALA